MLDSESSRDHSSNHDVSTRPIEIRMVSFSDRSVVISFCIEEFAKEKRFCRDLC